MAGIKISNLPAIVTPALTDIFATVQGGITYKETIAQLFTSPTMITPILGAAQATSITLGSGTALSDYVQGTWVPILTLVGGAGNTVPVYTTNTGIYTRIGNIVYCQILLDGDGGDEGAGTGAVNISLPIVAGANTAASKGVNGVGFNGATRYQLFAVTSASQIVASIFYWDTISSYVPLTGVDQNNISRTIGLEFSYFV